MARYNEQNTELVAEKSEGNGVVRFKCGCIKARNDFVRRCVKHALPQRSLSGRVRSLGAIVDGRVNRQKEE